jgi:hypothetical protein
VPRAAVLVALAVVLSSCTEETEQSCPGEVVEAFAFTGTPRIAGELGTLDPVPALTDCAPALGFPASLAFGASLAADAGASAGALCRNDGAVLFGTRTGDHWTLEETTEGAVLGGCDPTCAARSRVVISGDVVPGTPAAFAGALVEQLTATGGVCGACVLPCAARYALSGVPETP